MKYTLVCSDNIKYLKTLKDNSIDSCITDPPYGMEMDIWDFNVPTVKFWVEVHRVLKPGSFCLSFCSPQLYHRMASAIEDANFNIIDQVMWMTTTKMAVGNKLKPCHEPIAVAQKPFNGTISNNVKKWNVGKINTVDTRIPWDKTPPKGWVKGGHKRRTFGKEGKTTGSQEEFGKVDANPNGRYPSNIIGEVLPEHQKYFYAPRVTRKERGEYNDHPTPKPINLMRYLIRLFCPENGLVLDPFMGSGSTGLAALQENRTFLGIDQSNHYVDISQRRINEYSTILPDELLSKPDKQTKIQEINKLFRENP